MKAEPANAPIGPLLSGALYAVTGPPVGAIVQMALIRSQVGFRPEESVVGTLMTDGLWALLFTPFSYVVGSVPAFATGAIASFLWPRLSSRTFLLANVAVGTALSALAILFIKGGRIPSEDLAVAGEFVLCGAVAAFTCASVALWVWRRRLGALTSSEH